MAFQPFGIPFEIQSPLSAAEAKAVIRSQMKTWRDPKNGARGLIVGPVLCLWFNPSDRHGPMLIGLISQKIFGTRVRGWAGYNLKGVLLFTAFALLIGLVFVLMILQGSESPAVLLGCAAIFLVIGLIIYWSANKEKRHAEPLIRFLDNAITISGRKRHVEAIASVTTTRALTLNVSGDDITQSATLDSIQDALLQLGADDFAILSSNEESYIQTAWRDGSYVIEMRDGDAQRHFQAVRCGARFATAEAPNTLFTFEEMREVLLAYAVQAPMPSFVSWERMNLDE